MKAFQLRIIRSIAKYFTKGEILLWCISIAFIVLSFLVFDRKNCLPFAASIIGATSLLFNAKGNPIGPLLMIGFSALYGIISYTFSYYGEMITYLGMTAPMALFSLIAWLKNPYQGNRAQVKVNRLTEKEIRRMIFLTFLVTGVFYFILQAFHTANLLISTLSVATSFLAAYLTFYRSAFYALAYAVNDAVLIVLWTLAAATKLSYLSVVVCFITFLVNDMYGFFNWRKMERRQSREKIGQNAV